ncbi:MAG: choice-of-anchor D domain-containing protein, partial [Lysobacter sp.]|nr:choice-of-anchor D domain-containing protein [Lysobacter sp.]
PAPGPGNSCTVEVRFQPTVVGAASGTIAFASNGGSATLDLVGNGTALPVPGISLTPPSIAFPPQAVGTTSSPVQVTLSSAGTAPLAITSIGTTLGDFGLSTNCPIAPATLAAGSTCTITVTFAPLIEGSRIGTLTVASDAAQGTGSVALTGSGTPAPVPAVSVSSSAVSFPTTQVGTTSEPLSVTVTNAGGLPLAISAVEIVGSGFAIVSNSCVTTLPAGAQCSVTLVFAPSTTGTNAATLRILSNAPTSPTFVGLSGTATAVPVATLAAQPAALDFAIREVATTSPAQSVTLTNTGGATATISGVTVTGDFAQANNCSLVLPGGSCTISVTFTPTAAGTRAGSLVVAGDATNAPFAIALSGGGTPPPVPIIELSATSLSFGNSMVGRGSSSQAVTVRNTGGAPLVITSLNAPFEFPVSSGCPSSLPAGESCRLDVGFLPSVSGPRQGRMEVLSNASNGTVGVGLSGTGCRISFLNRNVSLICQ